MDTSLRGDYLLTQHCGDLLLHRHRPYALHRIRAVNRDLEEKAQSRNGGVDRGGGYAG